MIVASEPLLTLRHRLLQPHPSTHTHSRIHPHTRIHARTHTRTHARTHKHANAARAWHTACDELCGHGRCVIRWHDPHGHHDRPHSSAAVSAVPRYPISAGAFVSAGGPCPCGSLKAGGPCPCGSLKASGPCPGCSLKGGGPCPGCSLKAGGPCPGGGSLLIVDCGLHTGCIGVAWGEKHRSMAQRRCLPK